jgi:hypothetical protein
VFSLRYGLNTQILIRQPSAYFIYFCLPDCWLVVSMHPEGPATGHLDTGFLGFPLSSTKSWNGSQFQVATACFSCSPPNFKLIKIAPCCGCRRFNCFFKLSIKQSEIQNSAVCLKPPPYHHNVFTFTLFLPEGRAGVAWEASNKKKALSLFGFKWLNAWAHLFHHFLNYRHWSLVLPI